GAAALAAGRIGGRGVSANIFVVGAGAWGPALAQAARFAGNAVTLVGRNAAAVEEINSSHRLTRYLGDIALDRGLFARIDHSGIAEADAVLMVVPAQASRATLAAIGGENLAGKPVILCAKGL